MDLDVKELEKSWKSLIKQLNQTFDADLDIQGVLFLIGHCAKMDSSINWRRSMVCAFWSG
jgi:hypothetical protein